MFIYNLVSYIKKYYLIAIFSIAILSLLSSHLSAHSWYPSYCCGGHDCHPIDSCSEITTDSKGQLHWQNFTFPADSEHPSQDGHCHVCILPNADGKPTWPMCIFTQQSS